MFRWAKIPHLAPMERFCLPRWANFAHRYIGRQNLPTVAGQYSPTFGEQNLSTGTLRWFYPFELMEGVRSM